MQTASNGGQVQAPVRCWGCREVQVQLRHAARAQTVWPSHCHAFLCLPSLPPRFLPPAGKYTLDYSANPLKPRLGVEGAHSVHFGDMAPQDKLFVDCDAHGDVFFCPGSPVRGAPQALSRLPPACLAVTVSRGMAVGSAGFEYPCSF